MSAPLVADALLAAIPDDTTALGGLTMGADPVAFGVAGVAAARGRGLRAFSVRKVEPEGIPFAALVTAPDLGFAYEGAG